MSLINSIESIVNTKVPDATFVLSSWFNANRKSYKIEEITADKPLIVLNNEIRKDNEIQVNANILKDNRIVIRFLMKGGIYNSSAEMQADIELMESIADSIYPLIYRLPQVRLKGGDQRYSTTPVFKAWNSILNGVECEAKFKENVISNWCPNPTI